MSAGFRVRQRGAALLTAMLVVALATVLAAEMLWQINLNVRRAQALLTQDQARQFALGAEAWARDVLAADAREDDGTDHLQENWAQRLPPLLVDEGVLEGFVEDAQGRFNLNNLVNSRTGEVNEAVYEQFQRLLSILELDPALADAVVDWIDPDQVPMLQGAEDDAYTGLNPPYRAANFWFVTPTELLAVRGIDIDAWESLAPHVIALPMQRDGDGGFVHPVNLNTATEAVLLSLGPQLTVAEVEAWMEERPFNDLQRFDGLFDVPYSLSSSWFRLYVTVTVGTTRVAMYSLLERNGPAVTPRLRTFDTD
ncbi:MAG: type II secretion system minor pseudopilin GspK [Chromatiales bacterium]|nr:type II secretion system minor pseudopilin GspK [Chromatiales bacterium]